MNPGGHVDEEPGVERGTLVARVVGENGNLPHAVVHNLLELCLKGGYGAVVVGGRDGVAHEGVKRVDKAALGVVARLGKRIDLLAQLVLGVEVTPVGVVLGIVLGRVHVGVELVVAAPGHEVHAVLGAPGVTVVALDEAAGLNVGVVADGKRAQRGTVGLLEDLVERREAVVGRVGAVAQHDQLVGAVASGNGGEKVGVGLVEKTISYGKGAGLDELVYVGVNGTAGPLHAHKNRGRSA